MAITMDTVMPIQDQGPIPWCWMFQSNNVEGLPIDILTLDFWVPGSTARSDSTQYNGKPLFRQILDANEKSALLWVRRSIQEIL